MFVVNGNEWIKIVVQQPWVPWPLGGGRDGHEMMYAARVERSNDNEH